MKESINNAIRPLIGRPLDYSQRENWMIFGDNGDHDHEADVIFFYPTAADMACTTDVCEDLSLMKHNAMRSYIQSAETMADYADVYVPYYRQISLLRITNLSEADGLQREIENNVTRTDVYAALDHYFEYCNKGKPYILAGHSQGSCALKIVLSEYMRAHPDYYSRMVACYATGFYFPEKWFKENPHVKKAVGETDTGCLISWNTVGADLRRQPVLVVAGEYCINPLNWKTDESYADLSMNLGSCKVDKDTLEKTLLPGLADARIDRQWGEIVTSTYDKFIPENPMFGDKSCHFEDWSLFYMNIKENGRKRIEEFLKETV